jgi:hypothetical protein
MTGLTNIQRRIMGLSLAKREIATSALMCPPRIRRNALPFWGLSGCPRGEIARKEPRLRQRGHANLARAHACVRRAALEERARWLNQSERFASLQRSYFRDGVLRWSRLSEQIFRLDKWSLRRG